MFVLILYNFKNIKFENYFVKECDSEAHLNDNPDNNTNKFLFILITSCYILIAGVFTLIFINLATYLAVEKTGTISEYSGLIL